MKRVVLAVFLIGASGAWVKAQEPAQETHEQSGDPMILWKIANFVLLAAGLGYLMSRSLPAFFRSRTSGIQMGISEAQQMKRDAEKRAADMDARMNALGAEIDKFRTQSRAEMEKESERIRLETAKQIEKLQQQAEQEIESAGKAARRDLKNYAAELAVNLAEQRIKNRLDPATEIGLVEGFVDDLKRQDLQQQGSQN
jgi:F-type H+-transporting ATPase subunit b